MRALCLVALWFGVAHADTLTATRGQPLREVSHDVRISVGEGVASYRVQRVFANGGDVADEASLDIDLPFGGGVTGLRIRARDTWYDGDLMEAKSAAKLYEELTGFGPFPAKDPALLQWVWPDKVHLQIFPVLPGARSTVEYTITVPTRYLGGRYHLSYPRMDGPGLAAPAFVVEGHGVRYDGQAVADGARFALPPPKALPAWDGGVEREPGASYVVSRLEVPDVERARGELRAATLDLDVSHTYRGDLRVELVTPEGKRVVVHDRAGGSENDVRGRFALALPPGTHAVGRWRLVISDHAARDAGTLNRWALSFDLGRPQPLVLAASGPLFIPDAPESAGDHGLTAIELEAPAPRDSVDARLGRVVASAQHGFARLDIDAAAQLRPLPKQASVVFVVDASHSEGDDGIRAQLALARAYLGHVPDASFEVIAFRRFADRVLGTFAPATRAEALLAPSLVAGKLAPGNGSALELGLQAALEALRERSGPRRVVLLSDAELRSRFEVAAALPMLRALPPDVIVHLVVPMPGHGGEVVEERDDDHALAPLAAAGHGILLRLAAAPDASPAQLAHAVLGLVRPIRIDRFAVTGLDVPAVLAEGASVRTMVATQTPPRELTLDGLVWAEPFHRRVTATREFSKATAAFVFSEHQYTTLDEREQMTVALQGQVVSPVTSYVAAEPGTRPSTIGLRGLRGSGVGYGAGHGGLGGRHMAAIVTRPDLDALVAPRVARCEREHRPALGWRLALDVETTRDEIVDVALAGAADAFATCVVEAVWATRLPPGSRGFVRERYPLAYAN